MKNNLILLLIMAAILAFASWARADPDVCARSLDMVGECHEAAAHIQDMRAMYSQTCRDKPARRSCIDQRQEIRAFGAELYELQLATLDALRVCNASKATRKVSADQ